MQHLLPGGEHQYAAYYSLGCATSIPDMCECQIEKENKTGDEY
ncbi:hypothetical protein [Sporomusa sp. KB1]|nr:hypothetical protein [Sporomusa sp. KB1]